MVFLLLDGYALGEYGYYSASVKSWHLALAKLKEIGYTLFGDEFFMAFVWGFPVAVQWPDNLTLPQETAKV